MTSFPAQHTVYIWFADPNTVVYGVFGEEQLDLTRFEHFVERQAPMANVLAEIEDRFPGATIEMIGSGDPLLPVLDQYATEIRINVWESTSSDSITVA